MKKAGIPSRFRVRPKGSFRQVALLDGNEEGAQVALFLVNLGSSGVPTDCDP